MSTLGGMTALMPILQKLLSNPPTSTSVVGKSRMPMGAMNRGGLVNSGQALKAFSGGGMQAGFQGKGGGFNFSMNPSKTDLLLLSKLMGVDLNNYFNPQRPDFPVSGDDPYQLYGGEDLGGQGYGVDQGMNMTPFNASEIDNIEIPPDYQFNPNFL